MLFCRPGGPADLLEVRKACVDVYTKAQRLLCAHALALRGAAQRHGAVRRLAQPSPVASLRFKPWNHPERTAHRQHLNKIDCSALIYSSASRLHSHTASNTSHPLDDR